MRFLFGCSLILLAAVSLAPGVWAQEIPSPPAKAICTFPDGKTIHVDYSSPRMRGRKIFGGLVPYGEVWRAGANEATTFVINTNVSVDGLSIPPGHYTMFTLPNRDKWQLVISKMTGEWGIPYPGQEYDFGRAPMQLSALPSPVEDFLISFAQSGDKCTMHLDWEKTRASADIVEKK